MIERAGDEAKIGFKAHPHMLRHACGYALANKGHDTRALQAQDTAMSSTRLDTRSCRLPASRISGAARASPPAYVPSPPTDLIPVPYRGILGMDQNEERAYQLDWPTAHPGHRCRYHPGSSRRPLASRVREEPCSQTTGAYFL